MIFAKMPPSRIAPSIAGNCMRAVAGIISRGFSGRSSELPMTANVISSVSSNSVPTIQPPTASFASRSERAEKNFWYMP